MKIWIGLLIIMRMFAHNVTMPCAVIKKRKVKKNPKHIQGSQQEFHVAKASGDTKNIMHNLGQPSWGKLT